MSAAIIVNIKDMSETQFNQAWDLLSINNISASNHSNPINSTRNIEIELNENQHVANTLDSTLGYINKHIITN